MADTFDILLMRTNTYAASFVRLGTYSDYDHAAIVVRYSNSPDAWVFEATGDRNIIIRRFSAIAN